MWKMSVPVATPMNVQTLMLGLKALLYSNNHTANFQKSLSLFLNSDDIFLITSGRSALYLILKAFKSINDNRKEVIIPAFTCSSVAKAIAKAGLDVVLCDIELKGFRLNPDALEDIISEQTLAVIPTHLFGYPTDITKIVQLADKFGALVIENAAQTFGSTVNAHHVGTSGHAGIYSFGVSKTISTIRGGVIITKHNWVADLIAPMIKDLSPAPIAMQVLDFFKLVAFSVLQKSHYLGLLIKIWERKFQSVKDLADFEPMCYIPFQAAIGTYFIRRFKEIIETRRQNAVYLSEHLSVFPEIILPEIFPGSHPVFLRFPIIVKNPQARNELLHMLRSAGINVSSMYDRVHFQGLLTLVSRYDHCPNAEYCVDRMLLLPVHAYITKKDLENILSIFNKVLGNKLIRKK